MSETKLYEPSRSVTTVRVRPVDVAFAVTEAPGSAPPCSSVARPLRLAPEDCAAVGWVWRTGARPAAAAMPHSVQVLLMKSSSLKEKFFESDSRDWCLHLPSGSDGARAAPERRAMSWRATARCAEKPGSRPASRMKSW